MPAKETAQEGSPGAAAPITTMEDVEDFLRAFRREMNCKLESIHRKVDMLLKHQDLCYSSPASSASWPHHMVSPEGPRQIVLGNRELLSSIVIFLHQDDVMHLGAASRLTAVPLGLLSYDGCFGQRPLLLLLPHIRVPSQNSSRFPFQRVEWQQVRSLVISSTSLVWIKMHAVATGRTFALEAPVDFRLARLQRICISPATRKKDTTQAQRAMQVLVRCVLTPAARSLNSIWAHVPPEVNCESALTALESPHNPLIYLGFLPDAGLWNVGSDMPSWPLSARWLEPIITNSRASLRRIQLSGVVLSNTTWLNGCTVNYVDAAVQAMAKLEVLVSLSLILQFPDARGGTVEPMSLLRLRKAHPNHVYLCQARQGKFETLLSLTLGAARDEEHNLETDRALGHYSRIQQWSGRSVYMSEMSLFLPAGSDIVPGSERTAIQRVPSSLLLPRWSELPQPTQQLWDEVICLAVKRLHDKVKSRAQKSLAPVTTELRRAIARQD
ncbi:hypothetical protein Pmar_PMAR007684 [Perkinsus marinus ATCC 50983]|uniref:Uncharacterized protein n=1 Tax=Perkinsus marinus (strain ATCC 50983 / TXsc) TaxID=423536 RepID=C5LMU7_PERM5|nr:hypothetical protein Pmar_PMAR007684 [Perkinsus marinus ATCC 50983]EER01988.1 hypothetical protein Pmar_PMAR007684 [Perkinsus marinus ATCC 50983]|eukprot:XP_002769270.1 hypothetical protein Pmar_PMAR007684 [Perkinsus marinus ATCC 50983]